MRIVGIGMERVNERCVVRIDFGRTGSRFLVLGCNVWFVECDAVGFGNLFICFCFWFEMNCEGNCFI